jgi:hypothetical protein
VGQHYNILPIKFIKSTFHCTDSDYEYNITPLCHTETHPRFNHSTCRHSQRSDTMKSHQWWSGDVLTLYHIWCGGISTLTNRIEWTAEPFWRTKRPIKRDRNMEVKMSISECEINKRPLFMLPSKRAGISCCISIGQRTKFNWWLLLLLLLLLVVVVVVAAATTTANLRLYLL